MPKRPATRSTSRSSSNSSDGGTAHTTRSGKRFRSSSDYDDYADEIGVDDGLTPMKICVVQEKIEEQTVAELFALIESSHTEDDDSPYLQLCSEANNADVIITNIRMRKRLERHVDWTVARQKAIVTPDWLRASIKQGSPAKCGEYAALEELHDDTVAHCPDEDAAGKASSDNSSVTLVPESPSPVPDKGISTCKPTVPSVLENWNSKYACTRASPLLCPNQALVEELSVLGQSREFEGKGMNALAYDRAVAVIKSYPHTITKETYSRDVIHLPGLGEKILSKVREYMKNGHIQESQEIKASQRFQSLSTFSQIYGIGPANARRLYSIGLRTIADLERYYDVVPGSDTSIAAIAVESEQLLGPEIDAAAQSTATGYDEKPAARAPTKAKAKRGISGSGGNVPDVSIKIALALRADFEVSIPRVEVEEMQKVVMRELDAIQPGCVSTIVGGYRRGKSESSDVDIVISHSNLEHGADLVKGLCAKLTKRLHARGMVTHLMHLSGFHEHNALRQDHWDSLEKALTVFRLPTHGKEKRLHRRLDLVFAVPQAYWTAVVGWSGSTMFQRDLRLWAKAEKGMKFDSSGLTRRHDSKLYLPRSEQEVFDILGLNWIDPTMRHANV